MTFAINPEDAVNRRQAAAPTQSTAGVDGGSRGVALRAPQQGVVPGSDLMAVLKFSGGVLRERMEQAEEQAFLDGMSQAAQGVAAADIAAERPAWATAFGDDAATRGARAFEKVADSAALHTEVVEAMPELKRLSPEEFKAEVFRLLKARETGDPVRDAVLLQSTLGWLPNQMVSHAKAHKGWQQAEAVAADLQMKDKVITSYEAILAQGRDDPTLVDPVAQEAAAESVRQVLVPLPGVNVKEHSKRVSAILRDQLTAGNFGAWNVAKANGLLDDLDPDQVRMMQNTAREAAVRTLPSKAPSGAFDAWRALRLGVETTDEATIRAQVDKVNGEVRKATGIEETQFITPKMLDDLLYSKGIKAQQDAERAQREAAAERRADQRQAKSDARAAAREAARDKKRAEEELQRDAMVLAAWQRNVAAGQRLDPNAPDPVRGYMGIALDDATRGVRGAEGIERHIIDSSFSAAASDPAALAQTIRDFGPAKTPAGVKTELARAFDANKPNAFAIEALRRLQPFERGAILGPQGLAAYSAFDAGARQVGLDQITDPVQRQKAVQDLYDRARLETRLNPANARDASPTLLKAVNKQIRDVAMSPFDIDIGKVPPALVAHASTLVPPGEGREEAIAGMVSNFVAKPDDRVIIALDPTDSESRARLDQYARERPGLGLHIEKVLKDRKVGEDDVEYIMEAGKDGFQVFLTGYRSIFITKDDITKAAAPKRQ